MLRSLNDMRGRPISAVDGDIGKADDFLFDDAIWVVRYLVADVGGWLTNRQVLISPLAFGEPRPTAFDINLTKEQIEKSPKLDVANPISRRQELQLREHYGWPVYWGSTAAVGVEPIVPPIAPGGENVREQRERQDRERHLQSRRENDPNLRSIKEVSGYHIAATDGELGHVSDFIVDNRQWYIRYLVVDTRNWLPGKHVVISPEWVTEVEWLDGKVYLDVTREQVKNAPEYDPSTPVNRAFEEVLYDFYGRPRYW